MVTPWSTIRYNYHLQQWHHCTTGRTGASPTIAPETTKNRAWTKKQNPNVKSRHRAIHHPLNILTTCEYSDSLDIWKATLYALWEVRTSIWNKPRLQQHTNHSITHRSRGRVDHHRSNQQNREKDTRGTATTRRQTKKHKNKSKIREASVRTTDDDSSRYT